MLYIVVIAGCAFGFVAAYLVLCVKLSKSTKMRQRTMVIFVAVILLINYAEITKTQANETSTVLAFTDHISIGSSLFLFDID